MNCPKCGHEREAHNGSGCMATVKDVTCPKCDEKHVRFCSCVYTHNCIDAKTKPVYHDVR